MNIVQQSNWGTHDLQRMCLGIENKLIRAAVGCYLEHAVLVFY